MKFDRRANTTPVEFEIAPEPPSFEAPRTNWAGVVGSIVEGTGATVSNAYSQYTKAAQDVEKEAKDAAKLTEGNNLAREIQRLVDVREQTGNNAQFDLGIRKVTDRYLSRGLLQATDIANIRNQYDFGYLDMSEKSRERFAKADDEIQIARVTELQAMYPSLKHETVQNVLGIYQQVTTANDMYVDLSYKLSQIDKNLDPEGYKKLEETRDDFAKTNTYMNTLLKVQSAAATNPALLTDPVELEKMKQETIENLVRNGVERSRAIVISNEALRNSGVLDINKSEVDTLKLANKQMEEVWSYRINNARDTMGKKNPEIYAISAMRNVLGQDGFDKLKASDGGALLTKIVASIQGETVTIEDKDKGSMVDTAAKLMKGNATSQAKANLASAAVDSVEANGIKDYKSLPIIMKNVDGVLARLDSPYAKHITNNLKTSQDVNDNVLADKLERGLQKKRNFKKIANYINGPTEGGQLFRGNLQFVKDSLRVNDKGQLVYVAPEGASEAMLQGLAEQGISVRGALDTLNKDVSENLDSKGAELKQQWMDFGVPELQPGERVQGAPAFNTREGYSYMKPAAKFFSGITNPLKMLDAIREELAPKAKGDILSDEESAEIDRAYTAQLLREAADRVEQSSRGLSPAAEKEYSRGNKEAVERARKAADRITASAKVSGSETLSNAFVDYSVYKLIDQSEPEEVTVKETKKEAKPKLSTERDKELYEELKELREKRAAMNDGDEPYDTNKDMELSTRIAQILKELNIKETEGE